MTSNNRLLIRRHQRLNTDLAFLLNFVSRVYEIAPIIYQKDSLPKARQRDICTSGQ
jgi:hypothetical protein